MHNAVCYNNDPGKKKHSKLQKTNPSKAIIKGSVT